MSTEPTTDIEAFEAAFRAAATGIRDSWGVIVDALLAAFSAPGVREALVHAARAEAKRHREDAERLTSRAEGRGTGIAAAFSNGLDQGMARDHLRRAADLETAAEVFRTLNDPRTDDPPIRVHISRDPADAYRGLDPVTREAFMNAARRGLLGRRRH